MSILTAKEAPFADEWALLLLKSKLSATDAAEKKQ